MKFKWISGAYCRTLKLGGGLPSGHDNTKGIGDDSGDTWEHFKCKFHEIFMAASILILQDLLLFFLYMIYFGLVTYKYMKQMA